MFHDVFDLYGSAVKRAMVEYDLLSHGTLPRLPQLR